MAIEEIIQTPTRLTIYPDVQQAKDNVSSESDTAKAVQKNDSGTEYSFWDFLDLINPLQHIPVVNTLYREVTGDTIRPELKLAGGAALGGPLGFITSLADVIFEQETGKDIGSTMVATVMGNETADPVQVAKLEEATHELSALQTPLPASLPAVTDTKDKREDAQRVSQLDPTNKEILALYGASAPLQASKAYQQADMRGYLQQASLNATF